MKHIKIYEEFLNTFSEDVDSIVEKDDDKVYNVGNFIFNDKNNAGKYLDLLKKLTFEYSSGDDRLYSNGPKWDAFKIAEVDSKRINEAFFFEAIDNQDIADFVNDVLSGILKYFSAEVKKINGSKIILKLYSNRIQTSTYPVPGRFFNEKDAKQAIEFAKKYAIGYIDDRGPDYLSIDALSFYVSQQTYSDTFINRTEFVNLAKTAGSKIDFEDLEQKLAAFSNTEEAKRWESMANADQIQYTNPPKADIDHALDLPTYFEGLKNASSRYKLTGAEIFNVFMNRAAISNPEIVGWSSGYSYAARSIFWIAIRCKSGIILPVMVSPNTTGNKVDFYINQNWCMVHNPNVDIRSLNLPDSQSSNIDIMMKKLQKLIKAM